MLLHPFVVTSFLILAAVAMPAAVVRAQPVDKTEKVRPYEFGFTIDEQQHRHEERDERGIVMGEYGFITADGIYHVTVYATDEEGKFRILAMRNYPYESPPKTIEMIVRPKAKPLAPSTTTTTTKPATSLSLPKFNTNKNACSGCFIPKEPATPLSSSSASPPTSSLVGKTPKVPIRTLSKPLGPEEIRPPFTGSTGQLGVDGGDFINPLLNDVPNTQTNENFGITGKQPAVAAPGTTQTNVQQPEALPFDDLKQLLAQNIGVGSGGSGSGNGNGSGSGSGSGGSGTAGNGGFGSSAAVPAAKPGTASDFGDLYRFKYLLDYNGHSETGSRNGNKEGSFFSIGEDNVKRTIEYIANEYGFQPRISWRKLDASAQRPKENALKDYEFVWFRKD